MVHVDPLWPDSGPFGGPFGVLWPYSCSKVDERLQTMVSNNLLRRACLRASGSEQLVCLDLIG